MAKGTERKVRIGASFAIEPELRDKSEELAHQRGESFSAFVRRAIAEAVMRESSQEQVA